MKKINVDDILNLISEDGFADLTGIISDQQIDTINDKIRFAMDQPHSNGQRGYVKQGCQRYLADTLSYGQEIIDVYTNPILIDIAEKYAENLVHLSNYRIYSTYPSEDFKMWWHLDNKIDTYDFEKKTFIQQVVPDDKGLIFLMYLTDVVDGGVQLVKGSHKWSRKHDQESFDHMEDEFMDDIVTFNNCPKGTFVVYDYATIHRAKPYNGGQVRTSMFGQLSPSRMPAGEPILLNVRDICELSKKQEQVLNFGKNPTTLNWPIGDINAFYQPEQEGQSFWSKIKNKVFK
jgi:hypothetical protein